MLKPATRARWTSRYLAMMTYSEAIQYLYQLQRTGMKLGLENSRRLLQRLGHPESHLRFIHVAGTNGKGSVCAFSEAALRRGGYRTGLFTSPHLITFRERIQVNGAPVSERVIAEATTRLRTEIEQEWPPDGSGPTFFEASMALAALIFSEADCEVVLWETGLGGRLDATNVVAPILTAITEIGFDHQEWLGNTIESIAREKAGIIKPGTPVVYNISESSARHVIEARAAEHNAPIRRMASADLSFDRLESMGPTPAYQKQNMATVYGILSEIEPMFPGTLAQFEAAVQETQWPGRCQTIQIDTMPPLLIDGAHNPLAIDALANYLPQWSPDVAPHLWFATTQDKDWKASLGTLIPKTQSVRFFFLDDSRGEPPENLKAWLASEFPDHPSAIATHIGQELENRSSEAPTVIAGSLYFVGAALREIQAAGSAKEPSFSALHPTTDPRD